VIDSLVRLHSGLGDEHAARSIASTADIPEYQKAPLEHDVEAVIRPPWSYVDSERAVIHIVYTYRPAGGIVGRYRFTFQGAPTNAFYWCEYAELGRRVGAWEASL
jgi:hypothetical protein